MRTQSTGTRRLLLTFLLVLPCWSVHADSHSITVLYPTEVGADDVRLLTQIIEGIEAAAGERHVVTFRTVENDGLALRGFLRDQTPSNVIPLGRSSYELYQRHRTAGDPEPIVGALDITRDTHPRAKGVGMDVAPDELFVRLKRLAPQVSRILVVYDPHRDATNIRTAMSSASEHGLMLKGYQATDANQSSAHFSNLFRYANPTTDALWLPPDVNLIRLDTHLPEIVEESWGRRFVVFSSNADHAERGVLFVVYPDAQAVGRALVAVAAQDAFQRDGLRPLHDVESVLDLRVATRLELDTPPEARAFFTHLVRGN